MSFCIITGSDPCQEKSQWYWTSGYNAAQSGRTKIPASRNIKTRCIFLVKAVSSVASCSEDIARNNRVALLALQGVLFSN